jgi:hypothetical protein
VHGDIRFSVPNTPGRLAQAARVLGDAGVNIGGIGCDLRPGEKWGFIHFQVDDVEKAVRALEATGHEILDVHEVERVQIEDRPGALAELCQSYNDRGDNIEVLYVGTDNHIIVGTESMRKPFYGRRMDQTTYTDRRTSTES